MFDLFLLTFFFVNIGFRAKMRGLNPGLWVFAAILSVFAGVFIAMLIMMLTWMKQFHVSLEGLQKMIEGNEISPSLVNKMFFYIAALGGYLFIRYMVDKRGKIITPPNEDEME